MFNFSALVSEWRENPWKASELISEFIKYILNKKNEKKNNSNISLYVA